MDQSSEPKINKPKNNASNF